MKDRQAAIRELMRSGSHPEALDAILAAAREDLDYSDLLALCRFRRRIRKENPNLGSGKVIKVERPEWGDDTRRWGPPWLRDESGDETGESAYFLSTNRNKRSITVDLGHPGGQEITRNLVAQSDILLENFKVGSLHRFGLHAAAMRELNRRLVYCSISAYGQSGSKSAEPGYDAMMQAAGGLMSLTGMSAEEGGGPQKGRRPRRRHRSCLRWPKPVPAE